MRALAIARVCTWEPLESMIMTACLEKLRREKSEWEWKMEVGERECSTSSMLLSSKSEGRDVVPSIDLFIQSTILVLGELRMQYVYKNSLSKKTTFIYVYITHTCLFFIMCTDYTYENYFQRTIDSVTLHTHGCDVITKPIYLKWSFGPALLEIDLVSLV